MQALQQRGEGGGQGQGQGTGQGGGGEFTDRLERDEIRQNIDRFRAMVASEARRRTAELRGRDVVTKHAVRAGTERIDFLSASKQQLEELGRTVRPLARKLATRLAARRRKAHRGRIDIRRTLRRSMSTGGVPMHPVFAKPHPARPELVLLCDVSGSVVRLLPVHDAPGAGDERPVQQGAGLRLHQRHGRSHRSGQGGLRRPVARIAREAHITKWHTSSDYGEAFADFHADYMNAIGRARPC